MPSQIASRIASAGARAPPPTPPRRVARGGITTPKPVTPARAARAARGRRGPARAPARPRPSPAPAPRGPRAPRAPRAPGRPRAPARPRGPARRARAHRPVGPGPFGRGPRADRANVFSVAPHLRVLLASQQKHFKGIYRHDTITPKLSLQTVAPGHFLVRAPKITPGVRQHILSLLRRAPASLWVNGHKHSKKQAIGVIMRLLEQNHTVDIQLRKE